jgi:hypothetical protein
MRSASFGRSSGSVVAQARVYHPVAHGSALRLESTKSAVRDYERTAHSNVCTSAMRAL